MLILLGAGNDTTSNALILGLYYICRHADVQDRLRMELKEAFPNSEDVTYMKAKQLPYLVKLLLDPLGPFTY